MSREPQRLLDQLVGVCAAVFVAAAALYGAVWLVQQVWPWLCGFAALALLVAVVIWRNRRW